MPLYTSLQKRTVGSCISMAVCGKQIFLILSLRRIVYFFSSLPLFLFILCHVCYECASCMELVCFISSCFALCLLIYCNIFINVAVVSVFHFFFLHSNIFSHRSYFKAILHIVSLYLVCFTATMYIVFIGFIFTSSSFRHIYSVLAFTVYQRLIFVQRIFFYIISVCAIFRLNVYWIDTEQRITLLLKIDSHASIYYPAHTYISTK